MRGLVRRGSIAFIVTLVVAGLYAIWYRPSGQDALLADLATAVGSTLPFEGRLHGGFLPPDDRVARGTGLSAGGLPPDALIAIARLEKFAEASPSAAARAALGVAYLVQGDADRAISLLEEATFGEDAGVALSDLSAAYLLKARLIPGRRVEYLSRALEASTRSIRTAPSNEARFNRALSIDGLSSYVGQMDPWTDYLAAERDARWLDVAQRRVSRHGGQPDARERWEERKARFVQGAHKLDSAFIDDTVRTFPEASIELFERELLVTWARNPRGALDGPRRVAASILSATGDPMPAEEVALIGARPAELALAHLDYSEGLRQYDADDYAQARDAFARALVRFQKAGSPYAGWVETQQATILFQERHLESAERQLAAVERFARPRNYHTLLGRVLWLRGLVYSKQWRLPEALDAFRASAATFERCGEREYAVSLYSHIADALRTLGEQRQSWENIGKTLEGLPRVRKATRRYLFLFNASLFASSLELLEAALLFQDAAIREAAPRVGAFAMAEALAQRASIRVRRGDEAAALADLQSATDRIGDIPDGPLKQYARAEVEVARADVARLRRITPRLESMNDAIDFFAKTEPAMVPRLRLGMGRSQVAAGDFPSAEGSFARGIADLEGLQSRLGDDAMRMSYFDEGWDLFPEMIALQINARRDSAAAFEYAERSRARSLLALPGGEHGAGPRRLAEIQSALPRTVALLYFVTLPDRLLMWTITSLRANMTERVIARRDLEKLISRHRALLAGRRASQRSSEELYDVLIRPALATVSDYSTLVFAPDGELQRLPFATLRNADTGRYIVEEHETIVTPSASLFVASSGSLEPESNDSFGSALLMGNPASNPSGESSTLRSLEGAEREVSEVANLYSRRIVLTGAAATKERFVEAAPGYDVIHFGGHAIVNPEYPLFSRLAFAVATSGQPQSLYAHEIMRMPLRRTRLVILAACSTADGAVSRGEGVVSIARPFLAAGVPTVIASQWDVDDRSTERLFVAFHRALSVTRDPFSALRAAQLELMHSDDALLASPSSWGPFVALGTAFQRPLR